MSASEGSAEGAAEVHIVHVSDRQNVPLEEVTSSLELSKVDYTKERTKSLHARYCFGIIFLIMNLVAWFFRDYGQSVLPWIRCKFIFMLFLFEPLAFLFPSQLFNCGCDCGYAANLDNAAEFRQLRPQLLL